MSGVAGSDRITRENFDIVLQDYEKNILMNIPNYKGYEISGSYNSDKSKNSFGDMDIIIYIDSDEDKKSIKKDLSVYFKEQPDDTIVPFTSEKYKGKKYYNSGEIVTINYPQPDGTVQIDNIIATTKEEMNFKKSFLDLPAEKQGLILGLVKTTIQENHALIYKVGIDVSSLSPLQDGEEYEFNLSSVEIQLRAVIVEEIDGDYKQKSSRIIWRTKDWHFIHKIVKYNINNSFENLLTEVKFRIRHERSFQRIVGLFNSMITVKSGEVNTPKGLNKEKSIKLIGDLI
jgi:hypothetical protein